MKDQNKIQSMLQDVMEEEIPSSQVKLWPAVKANLVPGKSQIHQQGEKMNTIKPQRIPRFALAFFAILALLVITLVTPQGRSFAQSVLQFFARAESTEFPLQQTQTEFTLQQSQNVSEAPGPAEPTIAPPMPSISVSEAEALVGFDAAELPTVPDGFNYLGARVYGKTINIEYETQGSGGHLIIKQSPDGFYQSEWDSVPAEAIIPVKIGELDGEYTQGTFVVYAGETSATWNPEASILRLRWMDDGVWFELTKYGNVEAIEYLDQEGLIKLAESLTMQP
jgi:hypothetical protein